MKSKKKPVAKYSTKRPATASRAKKQIKIKKQGPNKDVLSIILFGISILTFLLAIISGKGLWNILHNTLFGLLSKGAYFLPFVFLYISIVYALDKPINIYRGVFAKSILLFILTCTLVQIIFGSNISPDNGIIKFINQAFIDGVTRVGGGLFSAIIAWPLLSLFGSAGSLSIISISIFILIMIISKTSLLDLFKGFSTPAKKIANYHQSIKDRNRANFELPPHPVSSNKEFFDYQKDPVESTQEPNLQESTCKIKPVHTYDTIKNDTNVSPTDKQIEDVINEKLKDENKTIHEFTASNLNNKEENASLPKKNKVDTYEFPSFDLLKTLKETDDRFNSEELKNTAQKLVETLQSFGVQTKLLDFSRGPSVTRYELQPSAGVKISKITGLSDDIALNLATAGVRIEAPIPNKAAVGIEVPNKIVSIVGIKGLISSPEFQNNKSDLTIALGQDISGNIAIGDISKMPHVLIAGSTGSGKSVCINSIIVSLIYKSSPENVRLLMIDPKVVELGVYNGIPHLLIPVVTDPKKAAGALNWAVSEMLNRYKIFAETGVRDLRGYNKLAKNREDLNPLPKIVIIIDELADLMMVAPSDVEDAICRLAQMARAAGMHLVIATQRPSVDVITGIIKANIPSRVAFAVSSQVDSRTIIDSAGAEKLLGRGDMLFFPIGYSKPVRVQGCFVSDKEVENVVNFVKDIHQSDYDEEISQEIDRLAVIEKSKSNNSFANDSNQDDELLPDAIECAVENGEISTSFLQRKLKLGYSRAARMIDEMEQRGIVGPKDGSKPRQTLISRQQWIEMNQNKA